MVYWVDVVTVREPKEDEVADKGGGNDYSEVEPAVRAQDCC